MRTIFLLSFIVAFLCFFENADARYNQGVKKDNREYSRWSKKARQNIGSIRRSLAKVYSPILTKMCNGVARNCDLFAHADILQLRNLFIADSQRLFQLGSARSPINNQNTSITVYGLEKNADLKSSLVETSSHHNSFGADFIGIEKREKFELYFLTHGCENVARDLFYAEVFNNYLKDALSWYFEKPTATNAFNIEIFKQIVGFVEKRLNKIPLQGRIVVSLAVLIPSKRKMFLHKLGASQAIEVVKDGHVLDLNKWAKDSAYGLSNDEFESILESSLKKTWFRIKDKVEQKSLTGAFLQFHVEPKERFILTSDRFYSYVATPRHDETDEIREKRIHSKLANLTSTTVREHFVNATAKNSPIDDEFTLIVIDILQN